MDIWTKTNTQDSIKYSLAHMLVEHLSRQNGRHNMLRQQIAARTDQCSFSLYAVNKINFFFQISTINML